MCYRIQIMLSLKGRHYCQVSVEVEEACTSEHGLAVSFNVNRDDIDYADKPPRCQAYA